MSGRNEHIADLLMGAALADRQLDGREYEAVQSLMREAMKVKKLPAALEKRLKSFKPSKLDVVATVRKLALASDSEKRHLLELIVKVHESDELWDLDEDAYLRRVANALGLAEDKYADLTVQVISIESIGESLGLAGPPPLPKA